MTLGKKIREIEKQNKVENNESQNFLIDLKISKLQR